MIFIDWKILKQCLREKSYFLAMVTVILSLTVGILCTLIIPVSWLKMFPVWGFFWTRIGSTTQSEKLFTPKSWILESLMILRVPEFTKVDIYVISEGALPRNIATFWFRSASCMAASFEDSLISTDAAKETSLLSPCMWLSRRTVRVMYPGFLSPIVPVLHPWAKNPLCQTFLANRSFKDHIVCPVAGPRAWCLLASVFITSLHCAPDLAQRAGFVQVEGAGFGPVRFFLVPYAYFYGEDCCRNLDEGNHWTIDIKLVSLTWRDEPANHTTYEEFLKTQS